MTTRLPHPALRPFVSMLWASDAEAEAASARVERMLPSASGHLVVRLGPEPAAVVGGPRTTPYFRTTSTVCTVGAMLKPGAAPLLLDALGTDLAERHTALDDVWGEAAHALADRLATEGGGSHNALLDAFDAALLARLHRPRAMHPAVALAVARLPSASVGDVVDQSGYSHRRFVELFTRATGLSPKRYARLVRYERALAAWGEAPATPLARLAAHAGYSDQAHLTREFARFTGLTPGEYRRVASVGSRHVPVNFVQDDPLDPWG